MCRQVRENVESRDHTRQKRLYSGELHVVEFKNEFRPRGKRVPLSVSSSHFQRVDGNNARRRGFERRKRIQISYYSHSNYIYLILTLRRIVTNNYLFTLVNIYLPIGVLK